MFDWGSSAIRNHKDEKNISGLFLNRSIKSNSEEKMAAPAITWGSFQLKRPAPYSTWSPTGKMKSLT